MKRLARLVIRDNQLIAKDIDGVVSTLDLTAKIPVHEPPSGASDKTVVLGLVADGLLKIERVLVGDFVVAPVGYGGA